MGDSINNDEAPAFLKMKKAMPNLSTEDYDHKKYDCIDDANMQPEMIAESVFDGVRLWIEYPVLQQPKDCENLPKNNPEKMKYESLQKQALNRAGTVLKEQVQGILKHYEIDAVGMGRVQGPSEWAHKYLHDSTKDPEHPVYKYATTLKNPDTSGLKPFQQASMTRDVQFFCGRCLKMTADVNDEDDHPCYCMVARGHWVKQPMFDWNVEKVKDESGRVVPNRARPGREADIGKQWPPKPDNFVLPEKQKKQSEYGAKLGRPKKSEAAPKKAPSDKEWETLPIVGFGNF